MTARVCFAVLLCLSGCLSTTEAALGLNTVKPGVCPNTKYEAAQCALIRFVSCANDSECAKREKCCNNGCGLQCMAPVTVTVKPGVCPYIKYVCTVEVEDKCVDDSECPKKEKCCATACNGRQCTAPVTVKPGVCPNIKYKPEECAWIRFMSCADDSNCAKNEKCCNNGCGLQCMAPVTVTVKPGVCPYIKYVCTVEVEDKCAADSECPKKEKCCATACNGRQLKPGVCPNIKYKPEECAWIRFVSCADDSNCAKNEKCCSNGCGLQCMAPVSAKPGVCPITNDGTIMCVRQDDELCASDSECPDNQKCCSTRCNGLDCMAPVTAVKPGVCPRRKYEAAMCPRIRFVSCVNDSDCAKTEKCCSNGCGLQCMAAVKAKPGVCPKRMPMMCPLMLSKPCADDSDCPDNEKCCSTCAGQGCIAPVTAKPGVCPSRKHKPGMCPLMNFMSCVDDSDCTTNNEKCCSNGCGLDCMAPVTEFLPY